MTGDSIFLFSVLGVLLSIIVVAYSLIHIWLNTLTMFHQLNTAKVRMQIATAKYVKNGDGYRRARALKLNSGLSSVIVITG